MARGLLLDTALPTPAPRVARALAGRPAGTAIDTGTAAISHVPVVITITPSGPRAGVNRVIPDVGGQRNVGFVQPSVAKRANPIAPMVNAGPISITDRDLVTLVAPRP